MSCRDGLSVWTLVEYVTSVESREPEDTSDSRDSNPAQKGIIVQHGSSLPLPMDRSMIVNVIQPCQISLNVQKMKMTLFKIVIIIISVGRAKQFIYFLL